MRQAENPTDLLPRVLTDTQGRYLAVFESEDYLDEIREPLEAFLRSTDAAVHFYRAECDCLAESEEVRKFCTAAEPGPKVLFCVNTPASSSPSRGWPVPSSCGRAGSRGRSARCSAVRWCVRPQAGAGVRPDREV